MKPPTIFALTLLVLELHRGCCILRPLIRPNENEIVINAGQSINFECIYPSKIFFFFPKYNKQDGQKIVAIQPEITGYEADGRHKYNFSLNNASPRDTGWYGCSEHNITITPKVFNYSNFSWIYFYVSSPNQLFIEEDEIRTILVIADHTAILPCRLTSPDLEVTLYNEDTDEIVNIGENISYDPKFGFKFNNPRIADSNLFECSSTTNGKVHIMTYQLLVKRDIPVDSPKIDNTTLKYVVKGQTLYVNCTIRLHSYDSYPLDWNTPHQSSRISTQLYINQIKWATWELIRELIIKNVTAEDEGNYTCYVKTDTELLETHTYLKVYDPKKKYINLKPQDTKMNYQLLSGENVTWVIMVDAYPEPELTWLLPSGHKIVPRWFDPKYTISRTLWSTSLTITRLEISDMGVYQLWAIYDDNTEKFLSFLLEVLDKPLLKLKGLERHYESGQNAHIECEVSTALRPNIMWSFRRYPHYPSIENSRVTKLKNEIEKLNPYVFLLKESIKIDYYGIVNCTACNLIGCNYVSGNISVYDGNRDFSILKPKEEIIEDDSINITCIASTYDYTNNIMWTKGDGNKPIVNNGNIIVDKDNTSFTYRLILSIQKVRKEDAGFYTCAAETRNGSFKAEKYNLLVNDKKPPVFTNSSLNRKDLTIDLNEEHYGPWTLMCYVNGIPKPNVTWYKDGVSLNNRLTIRERMDGKNQYSFFNDSQELQINYFLERDTGKYSCRATNRLYTIEDFINIRVKGKELSKGLISMIVILCIIVLMLVIYLRIKVRREKILRKELLKTGLMHFEKGALKNLNPALTVDDQAELLPYDKKWEFPRERLKLGKKLGSGQFGVVMKADAVGISKNEMVTTVAVKMVRRATDPTYIRALVRELKIMVHLGKHLNVVNLLGACTKYISERELLVIVEYCPFGNLHSYLLKHKANFINQIDPATGKFNFMIGTDLLTKTTNVANNNSNSANSEPKTVHHDTCNTSDSTDMTSDGCILVCNNSSQLDRRPTYCADCKDQNLKPICTQDLLSWAFQVARGMEYLVQRKILHGDLAARNILLAEDNVVKICDFGLARTMYMEGNYKKKGNEPLPVKWMAIESIRDRVFSTQSDIWSFGIVLWEFFTLAETPYSSMEVEIQYKKLVEGYRMEQPPYSTNEVYQIMLQCWETKPQFRPSFTKLVDSIGNLLEENVKTHYINLNKPYMYMNTMILEEKNDYLAMMSAPNHAALSSSTFNLPNTDNVLESAYLCMNPTNPKQGSCTFSSRLKSE